MLLSHPDEREVPVLLLFFSSISATIVVQELPYTTYSSYPSSTGATLYYSGATLVVQELPYTTYRSYPSSTGATLYYL